MILSKTAKRLRRIATENTEPTKTDQSFRKDCDVNTIISKFKKTGQITHLARNQGVYADLSTVTDLLSSLNQVKQAEEAFMTIPSELRYRLNNSPAEFVEWINDPKNNEEAIKYGLKSRSEIPDEPKTLTKEKPNAKSPKNTDPDTSGSDPK